MSAADSLQATVTLRRAAGRVGADRIALLRAIGDTGSISAAARAVPVSYKAAWDGVQVLNNLFERPLIAASAGGRDGGASVITEAGRAVLAAYDAVEAELSVTMDRLEASLSSVHGSALKPLLWGIAMKTSARNTLSGTIARVTPGAVNSEVALRVTDELEIIATITRASVDALGLAPGVPALALIKSSFVTLARGDGNVRTSARNTLAGIVARREDGAVGSEITLNLETGKTITATLTCESANALDLTTGVAALALIKASHVIIAVE